jgi:hypothetical protein
VHEELVASLSSLEYLNGRCWRCSGLCCQVITGASTVIRGAVTNRLLCAFSVCRADG